MMKSPSSQPRPAKYLSEDEIVNELVYGLSKQEVDLLLEIPFDDLIGLHHSVGRQIRNQYKLWDCRNPYVETEHETSPSHPDQMSQRIIEKVWKKVHTTQDVNYANETA